MYLKKNGGHLRDKDNISKLGRLESLHRTSQGTDNSTKWTVPKEKEKDFNLRFNRYRNLADAVLYYNIQDERIDAFNKR